MGLAEEISGIASLYEASIGKSGCVYTVEKVVAERRAFLSKKKLVYTAQIKIDDESMELHFSESLKETGSGISTGSGIEQMTCGYGFKKETYNTKGIQRTGLIEEQSKLPGKNYDYKFDYGELRAAIESISKKRGYNFVYQILPLS